MKVEHCPSCGSENIDVSSWNAEYKGATTWDCENCSWSYTKGSGYTSSSGTHPKDMNTGSQSKLTSVGTHCDVCGLVTKDAHACTAKKAIEMSDNKSLTQDEVIDIISEYHSYKPQDQLIEEVVHGDVILTPTFYHVTLPSDEILDEHQKLVEHEVEQMIDEGLDGDNESIYGAPAGLVDPDDLYRRMNAKTGAEKRMIARLIKRSDSLGTDNKIYIGPTDHQKVHGRVRL